MGNLGSILFELTIKRPRIRLIGYDALTAHRIVADGPVGLDRPINGDGDGPGACEYQFDGSFDVGHGLHGYRDHAHTWKIAL